MPLHSLARKQPDRNLEGILAHHALRSFDDARVEIEQNILASAGKSASKPANDDYSFRTKSYSAPTYGSQFVSYAMGNAYHERFVRNNNDFSNRVPSKTIHIMPKNYMGGVLGYTYLGESMMVLRDDLIGSLKKEVDIHESIHTPDEYETICLTRWMMEKSKPKYSLDSFFLSRT